MNSALVFILDDEIDVDIYIRLKEKFTHRKNESSNKKNQKVKVSVVSPSI